MALNNLAEKKEAEREEGEEVEKDVGALWARTVDATEHAIACGALHSIPTRVEIVRDHGLPFIVRKLIRTESAPEKRSRSDRSNDDGEHGPNPFLPFEQDLFVADLSDTHLCILNKYNVQAHHLLIITRQFEEQEALLTASDFAAMWHCLAEIDGLAFYNGGEAAGASQPHKHLQLVPLPLTNSGPELPLDALLQETGSVPIFGSFAQLPFAHLVAPTEDLAVMSPAQAAGETRARYLRMLDQVGVPWHVDVASRRQPGPYNLLVTRTWMWLIPRRQHAFRSIQVNALGYAGSLFVRTQRQGQILRALGPMSILEAVSMRR